MLLGLEAPEEDLAQAFALARVFGLVKGFAVGLKIFVEPAVEWFAGRIDDREATERMAGAFARLSDLWQAGGRGANDGGGGGRSAASRSPTNETGGHAP